MKTLKPLEAIQDAKTKLAENYKLVCDLEIECVNNKFSEELVQNTIQTSYETRGALIEVIHSLLKEQKKGDKLVNDGKILI